MGVKGLPLPSVPLLGVLTLSIVRCVSYVDLVVHFVLQYIFIPIQTCIAHEVAISFSHEFSVLYGAAGC